MKRLLLLSVSLFVSGALLAGANLLSDPSFEEVGDLHWVNSASDPDFAYDFDSTTDTRTGSESLSVFWSANVAQWTGFFAEQFIPVTESRPYYSEVYAKVTEAFNNVEVYMETIFRDDTGGEVGAHLQSIKLGPSVVDWTMLSNEGTVPVGATTSQVRLVTFCVGEGGSDSGALYWDDTFAQIPEPVTATLLCIGLGGLYLVRRKRTAKN